MQLDWPTFLLEILNFLILIWILKQFLYRPVLDVIARRRAAIEKTLSDAKAIEAQALALKRQYEGRQVEWQREQAAAHARLAADIEAERERFTAALEASLAQTREKNRVLEQRSRAVWQRETEERAVTLGAAFVSRLLARFAGPDVEARLIDLVLEHLRQMSPEEVPAFAKGTARSERRIQVASAFALTGAQRHALAEAFAVLAGGKPAIEFSEDSALIAGLRVSMGSWVMHANLADELKFFTEAAHRGA